MNRIIISRAASWCNLSSHTQKRPHGKWKVLPYYCLIFAISLLSIDWAAPERERPEAATGGLWPHGKWKILPHSLLVITGCWP